jgi:hypothetical protein
MRHEQRLPRRWTGRWLLGAALIGLGATAVAHEPIAKCIAIDVTTIRCTGGYGHGEGAPGTTMDVISHGGEVLVAGKLGKDSTLTFTRPEGAFYLLFDVGPGHQAVVEHDEIE